jgi:hypothetical protein
MQLPQVQLIINIIKTHPNGIKPSLLAAEANMTKRRLYDLLPTLEALGKIKRSRNFIEWVEVLEVLEVLPDETHESSNGPEGSFEGSILQVDTVGAITSVKRLSGQSLMIEQTAQGFNVRPLED